MAFSGMKNNVADAGDDKHNGVKWRGRSMKNEKLGGQTDGVT